MPAVGIVANGKKSTGVSSYFAGKSWMVYIGVGLSIRLNEDQSNVSIKMKSQTDGARLASILFERCRKASKTNDLLNLAELPSPLVNVHA